MITVLSLAIVLQGPATPVQSQPVVPVKVGMDIAAIGKAYPSNYFARLDPVQLPKIDKLSSAKQKSYSGEVFIRGYYPNGADRMYGFEKGKAVVNFPTQDEAYGKHITSIPELLRLLPKGADVRYDAGRALNFNVELPKDFKKLKGFVGSIQPTPTKHLYADFMLIIKNDKVVEVKVPGI